jgi:hypothetical protein
VLDLSEAVEERIKSAFDMTKIGKDVLMKGKLQLQLCFTWFVFSVVFASVGAQFAVPALSCFAAAVSDPREGDSRASYLIRRFLFLLPSASH